jgi:hypothetical protein
MVNLDLVAILAGKVITIKYISDGLGTDSEMRVHKLAEEAIYTSILLMLLLLLKQICQNTL